MVRGLPRDASFWTFLFSVDKEQALAFVILLRLVRLLPLSLGYVSLLRAGLGLSEIKSLPAREAR